MFSGKNLLDFRRTRRLTFPRLPRARFAGPDVPGVCQRLIVHDLTGFPETDPATAGISSLFELTGRVRLREFSENERRYHRQNAFFHSTPSVLHMRHIHSLLVNWNDHAWVAGFGVSRTPRASAATGVTSKRPMPGRLQSCDIRKAPLAPLFLVVAAVSSLPFLFMNNASTAEPKRVLIVHSFSDAAPSLTIHSFE